MKRVSLYSNCDCGLEARINFYITICVRINGNLEICEYSLLSIIELMIIILRNDEFIKVSIEGTIKEKEEDQE